MDLYSALIKPLAFLMDPEAAHEIALRLISRGVFEGVALHHPALEQELFGVRFPNPLGLAAGFDKNGLAIEQWEGLDFGFAEIGTVTADWQPGNPRPRMFRIPQDEALINRLGFNNEGARAISARLREARAEIPIGVNIGKSRETPLENAARDYAKSFRLLAPHAAYVVVNVSSPNTPGLRDLQSPGALTEILATLKAIDPAKPLFVKVAPDLSAAEIDGIVRVVHEQRLTGIVATNTTVSREGISRDPGEAGGLSGKPLRTRANEVLSYFADSCDENVVLIGVGGIFSGEDLFERIAHGAHLCQVYTGFVYGGPGMPRRSLKCLVDKMEAAGILSQRELRGSGLKEPRPA